MAKTTAQKTASIVSSLIFIIRKNALSVRCTAAEHTSSSPSSPYFCGMDSCSLCFVTMTTTRVPLSCSWVSCFLLARRQYNCSPLPRAPRSYVLSFASVCLIPANEDDRKGRRFGEKWCHAKTQSTVSIYSLILPLRLYEENCKSGHRRLERKRTGTGTHQTNRKESTVIENREEGRTEGETRRINSHKM